MCQILRKVYKVITEEKIEQYIEKIPPMPKTLQATIQLLREGDLVKSAKIAKTDNALNAYLKELVNKPIYGFKHEVNELSQIFGILGVAKAQQAVYSYMVSLLSPDKWTFFHLNKNSFYSLQAELSVGWQKILKHLDINDKELESAIALLPASIIVSEALFCEKKEDVLLIRSVEDIDLNTMLKRLCHKDIFDVCAMIASKWHMSDEIITIVQASSGKKEIADPQLERLGKWMHLLLFYVLSKPSYVEAELNDFIEFNVVYVEDIYEEFASLMEVA